MADNDQGNDNIQALRQAADEGSNAKKELEKMKRELAFSKAGVDTEKGVGALLFKAYDGEVSSDAIKAAAEEYGIGKTETKAVVVETETVHDTSQTDARQELASGSGTPNADEGEDPYKTAEDNFFAATKRGMTPERAASAAFEPLLKAALKGDKRVIVER